MRRVLIILTSVVAFLIFVMVFALFTTEEDVTAISTAYVSTWHGTLENKNSALVIEQHEAVREQSVVNEVNKAQADGKVIFTFPLQHNGGSVYCTSAFNVYRNLGVGTNQHNGTDLAMGGNPTDINVLAMADAVVTSTGSELGANGRGNYVIMKTLSSELIITYMHLRDKVTLLSGTHVRAGDIVGVMGTTGASTGIHLHVGVQYEKGDGAYEVVDVGRTKNLLNMFDNRYFRYRKSTFPTDWHPGELAEDVMLFDDKE